MPLPTIPGKGYLLVTPESGDRMPFALREAIDACHAVHLIPEIFRFHWE
jgi:hypothetical protein